MCDATCFVTVGVHCVYAPGHVWGSQVLNVAHVLPEGRLGVEGVVL